MSPTLLNHWLLLVIIFTHLTKFLCNLLWGTQTKCSNHVIHDWPNYLSVSDSIWTSPQHSGVSWHLRIVRWVNIWFKHRCLPFKAINFITWYKTTLVIAGRKKTGFRNERQRIKLDKFAADAVALALWNSCLYRESTLCSATFFSCICDMFCRNDERYSEVMSLKSWTLSDVVQNTRTNPLPMPCQSINQSIYLPFFYIQYLNYREPIGARTLFYLIEKIRCFYAVLANKIIRCIFLCSCHCLEGIWIRSETVNG